MKNSQFDAKTFGVGQLITQRKLFRVPPHQRSYAWETEAVKSFFEDIEDAHARRDSDYFIGLVVLLGPENGEWVLLDGQQRLTTASLIFAAIRHWLSENGLDDDAKQIDREYLGVRRLGGDYSSRMQLNSENQDAFLSAVIEPTATHELRQLAAASGKKASNRLLLSAAIACREWVAKLAENRPAPERALFDLVGFLDARVKVVCVDVSSEMDAYVLFESLNDRGIELSALDLIKNHIIGRDNTLEAKWSELIDIVGDANPDDFLKVFWTNRYGIAQKTQIFRRVKETYADTLSVRQLMCQLIEDAVVLSALDDDDHPYWREFAPFVKDQVFLIRQLGTRQARPVIIAALRNLDRSVIGDFLWQLIVGVVRFQVVWKGRTGVIEKVFGRVCQALSRGNVYTAGDSREMLSDLFVPDEQFEAAFRAHIDSRFARIAYLLAEITAWRQRPSLIAEQRAGEVRALVRDSELETILMENDLGRIANPQMSRRLGNYVLSIDGVRIHDASSPFVASADDIEARSEQLAIDAVSVWVA